MKLLLSWFILSLPMSLLALSEPCYVQIETAKDVVKSINKSEDKDVSIYKSCQSNLTGVLNIIADDNYSYDVWQVSGVKHSGNRNCVIRKVELVETNDPKLECK